MKYFSDKAYVYYPGTSVPVNELGIKDPDEIEELETQLFLKTYEHFHKNLDEETVFDQEYLKDLHRFAFSKLYTWAGQFRDKNISKGNAVFCQAMHIESEANRIFIELKEENYLRGFYGKSKEEFAERIAYYMCELVALHPFFELNGRTIRLFFDMIAIYNGYEYISYEGIGNREDNAFIQASKHCMSGDCQPMEKIIIRGLREAK